MRDPHVKSEKLYSQHCTKNPANNYCLPTCAGTALENTSHRSVVQPRLARSVQKIKVSYFLVRHKHTVNKQFFV